MTPRKSSGKEPANTTPGKPKQVNTRNSTVSRELFNRLAVKTKINRGNGEPRGPKKKKGSHHEKSRKDKASGGSDET